MKNDLINEFSRYTGRFLGGYAIGLFIGNVLVKVFYAWLLYRMFFWFVKFVNGGN